jgi:hypothetical protein
MKFWLAFWFLQDGVEPKPLPVEKQGDGLAAKYPRDAGLEKDPKVILRETFESGDLKQWSETKSFPGTLEFDSKTAHSGSKSLRITATLGQDTGGHLWKMLKPGFDRLHFRFYVYFPEGHDYIHHFVHLCGYNPPTAWPQGGAGERPKGNERFSTGLDITGDWGKLTPPGRWMFYSYWCEMKGSPDGKFWGNAPKQEKIVAAETGRWVCAEFMIKTNTVGKDDGEQAYWIDGACVGRWGGYRWRTDEALKVNGVWLLYYITENAARQNRVQDPRKTNQVYFDDLVVAQEYIGPMKDRR